MPQLHPDPDFIGEGILYMSTVKKILIIDDDASLQQIYRDKLTSEGFTAFQAFEGKEGLMLVRAKEPDLIILDIMLPGGMNGFDILEELKRSALLKDIPVLILTNLESEARVAKIIGANQYLVKSDTTLEEVIRHVRELVK